MVCLDLLQFAKDLLKYVFLDMVNPDFAVHLLKKTCLNLKVFISECVKILLVELENTFPGS